MERTHTETVTRDFSVVHATVHFPDGDTENVEYVESWDRGETVECFDISDESWRTYTNSDGEPKLDYTKRRDQKTIFSTHNFEKIETNWSEQLTAVAEVEVTETVHKGLLRSWSEYDAELVDGVTVWERHEWEASQ